MVNLSVGQFTAIEVDPAEYIAIAASAGCQKVSLLTNSPSPQMQLPLVNRENFERVRKALATTGLTVSNVECFMITPDTNVEDFRQAMALGRDLGAVGATALLFDADEIRVKKKLAQLCAMAGEYGLRTSIEFMPMTPRWHTLAEITALIQEIGHPNLGICIDLLHLVRSGGTPEDVTAIPQELIHYAQLCDSADVRANRDYAVEAGSNRLAPGEGRFPLQAFLQLLPTTATLEIEVPQPQNRPAGERVKAIVDATRRQLGLAGRG
jgi:sugar phosphate isomerase/epimerase